MNMYVCKYCGIEKEVSYFRQDKYHKLGHRKRCKDCDKIFKELQSQIEMMIPEQRIQLFLNMYYSDLLLEDKEWASLFSCTLSNIIELRQQYDIKKCTCCKVVKSISSFNECTIQSNRDCRFSYCINCYTQYHIEYRSDIEKMEIRNKHIKNWYENNKEWCSERARQWQENKRESDPQFRLIQNFRNAFRNHLVNFVTNGKITKDGKHTEEIIGYTFQELIFHLESLFQSGMTWDNYGEWHIDHKRPISLFTFSSTDDPNLKECWSLQNLQPLWAEDNLRKSNKY